MNANTNITRVFCIAFLIALLIPNIVLFFGLDKDVKSNTSITFKKRPEFNFKTPMKSIGNYKNYYLENHGLKKSHINNYIALKKQILNDNPIPNRVVKGKDDWYFLGNHYNNAFNDAYGHTVITKEELDAISKSIIDTDAYLKSLNIDFYIVIPPNKHTVYKENLPYTLEEKPTRFDVLNDYLKERTDFKIIDLRSHILSEKDKELYLKTDTHWNEHGAFIGYNVVMNEIAKKRNITKRSINEYDIESKTIGERDLDRMINLNQTVANTILVPKFEEQANTIISSRNRIHVKNDKRDLKLLMYRDSFAEAWMDFFNETFGESLYLRGYSVKKGDIKKEQPDVVILEVIERNLTLIGK